MIIVTDHCTDIAPVSVVSLRLYVIYCFDISHLYVQFNLCLHVNA